MNPNEKSPSSRTAAFLLCLLLGTLGAHRFYVGRISGLWFVLLSLTGIGWPVAALWCLSDLIEIGSSRFADVVGRKLTA